MPHPDADRHGSEAGRRAVQYGLCFHGDPAGHGAGCVVGAAGVGIQRVLTAGGTWEGTIITFHVLAQKADWII